MMDAGTGTNTVDESTLTKGQHRKLNALRKSVGPDIGERAFAEWLASQAKVGKKADKNVETIGDALWPLVQQGKLQIRRGGYLVRRGRGRILVEPVEPTPASVSAKDSSEGVWQPAVEAPRPAVA